MACPYCGGKTGSNKSGGHTAEGKTGGAMVTKSPIKAPMPAKMSAGRNK